MQSFAILSSAHVGTAFPRCARSALRLVLPLAALVACSGPAIDEAETTTRDQALTQGAFNVAREPGASARAQSTYPGYDPARAVDGSVDTSVGPQFSWANAHTSGTDGRLPQWFEVNFAGDRRVDSVALYTSAGYELKDYDVEVWNGATWAAVASRRGNTQSTVTDTFTPTATNKLRIMALRGPDAQSVYARINELEVYGSDAGASGRVEAYLRQAGASTALDIGTTEWIDSCRIHLERGAAGREVTDECVYNPPPGYQMFEPTVDVITNIRGSFTSSLLAANSTIEMTQRELVNVGAAIDAAVSAGDFEAAGSLEAEYDRRAELYWSYASSDNAHVITATANPGLFRRSEIDVQGRVRLVRLR